MTAVAWSCRCGAVHGTVDVERRAGTPVVCHCDSCTRAQRHWGVEATRTQGVAIYQTTPDRVSIHSGASNLGLGRLSPKGSYRWYATCCDTQIGVSSTTPKFAFIGFVQSVFSDTSALGRARTHSYIPQPGGGEKHTRLMPAVVAVMARAMFARTSGRWQDTPFFDVETGAPMAAPALLPKDAGRS